MRLPSILMLHVSRALELRIGLRVGLRAEFQGGDPLGPPIDTHTPPTLFGLDASSLS